MFRREYGEVKRENLPKQCSKNAQNLFFFFFGFDGGLGAFIGQKWPFGFQQPPVRFGSPLVAAGLDANISNPSFFLCLASDAYLKAIPKSDWAYLGVLEKVWMCTFQNTKETKIMMVESKVMASRSELMHLAWFLGYLNHYNSNF